MFKIQYYIFLLLILTGSYHTFSQKKNDRIKYKADVGERMMRDGIRVQKLTHNVVFIQENTTVYCDSSYFYKETNVMDAYGHVKIVEDSTVITADRLIYNGDLRTAKLRDNVVYTKGENRLYTNFLDYDLDNEIAHYFNKGKLVDSTNTLTSKIGYYYSQEDYAIFWVNVVLDAPDYDLMADTLRYNTETKVAYTFGPTKVIKEDGSILNAKKGEFRTEVDQSEFDDGQIETEEYYMEGDDLFFDEIEKYYKAIGNVKLTSKEDSIIIIGDEGYYDKQAGISKVYGRPVMKKPVKNDTLYLSADTLVAIESEYDSLKRILAYYDVKIFKKGLSGIADSMAYFKKDSLLIFYNDPVMWNAKNQSIADTIKLLIRNENMDKMFLRSNAFLISEDTLKNYNQIKGRNMVSKFIDNKIHTMDVNGNGEMLYYSLEEGDSVLMGMNKIFCSHMHIDFKDNDLIRFKVYVNPDANFIPPHELTPQIQRLEGFSWRIDEKPALFDVAYYLDSTKSYKKPKPRVVDSTTIDTLDVQKEEISSPTLEREAPRNAQDLMIKGRMRGRSPGLKEEDESSETVKKTKID